MVSRSSATAMFKFPYHNPYERIIVVVGSVLVFASLLACVWRGWFSRVSCCWPLCVRAIQVPAKRSYDMINLIMEVFDFVRASTEKLHFVDLVCSLDYCNCFDTRVASPQICHKTWTCL